MSSVIGLIIFAIAVLIKKYKAIIKKKKDKMVLFAKTKLNAIEILYSKASINRNMSHNEFV